MDSESICLKIRLILHQYPPADELQVHARITLYFLNVVLLQGGGMTRRMLMILFNNNRRSGIRG